MDDKIERKCPVCGVVYHAYATRLKLGRQTTCSRSCSYRLRASNLRKGEEKQCGGCGKNIVVIPSKAKRVRHGMYFCSNACAYGNRKRVVTNPYVITRTFDRSAAAQKAWDTRRRDARPYPNAAREKARARAIERLQHGDRVSKFERKAAEVFRRLGFSIDTSVAVRSSNGTFAHVFDIVIASRRIAVECHGTYWHGGRWSWVECDSTQAKNLAYEERKMVAAFRIGLDVRILWEHHFKEDPAGACLAVVR
jgi:G:T-mismatch repair DNA endonuclease (very short patch repair protein)